MNPRRFYFYAALFGWGVEKAFGRYSLLIRRPIFLLVHNLAPINHSTLAEKLTFYEILGQYFTIFFQFYIYMAQHIFNPINGLNLFMILYCIESVSIPILIFERKLFLEIYFDPNWRFWIQSFRLFNFLIQMGNMKYRNDMRRIGSWNWNIASIWTFTVRNCIEDSIFGGRSFNKFGSINICARHHAFCHIWHLS